MACVECIGPVSPCVADGCPVCCACGRQLVFDEVECVPGLWAPDIGCNGKVCGWWPCECEEEEVADDGP